MTHLIVHVVIQPTASKPVPHISLVTTCDSIRCLFMGSWHNGKAFRAENKKGLMSAYIATNSSLCSCFRFMLSTLTAKQFAEKHNTWTKFSIFSLRSLENTITGLLFGVSLYIWLQQRFRFICFGDSSDKNDTSCIIRGVATGWASYMFAKYLNDPPSAPITLQYLLF